MKLLAYSLTLQLSSLHISISIELQRIQFIKVVDAKWQNQIWIHEIYLLRFSPACQNLSYTTVWFTRSKVSFYYPRAGGKMNFLFFKCNFYNKKIIWALSHQLLTMPIIVPPIIPIITSQLAPSHQLSILDLNLIDSSLPYCCYNYTFIYCQQYRLLRASILVRANWRKLTMSKLLLNGFGGWRGWFRSTKYPLLNILRKQINQWM